MVFGIFYYLINGIAWYCIVLYCVVGFGARAVSRKTPIYFMKTFTCIYFDVLMVFSIVLRHHLQKIEIISKRIGNYLEYMLFVVSNHAFWAQISVLRDGPQKL